MKKNHNDEGNLTPKTIKKLWITGSHRVQNVSEWKDNESTTLAYTGKATYKKLDKKGTKFLLNNSSTGKLKNLYKDAGFHIGTEDAPRLISSKGDRRIPVPELFVTNYPIDL